MGSVLTGQAACRDRCAQAAARVALYSGAPLAAGRGRQRPTTPAGFYAFIARGHNNYATHGNFTSIKNLLFSFLCFKKT